MTIEERFYRFVEELNNSSPADPARTLKNMNVEEVPPEYQQAFTFWKGLSGKSRNLMLNNALGRKLRKRY